MDNAASYEDVEIEEEIKPSRFDLFFRLLTLAILAGSLFLFLQMKEARVDILKVGMPASKYIVAHVDFVFPDDEKTFLMRQEAARAIGVVYKIDDKQLFDRKIEVDRDLIFNPTWRKLSQTVSFEEMYRIVDSVQKALAASRFSDAGTINEVMSLPPNALFKRFILLPFAPPPTLQGEINLPHDLWDKVQAVTFAGQLYSKEAVTFVIDYYRQKSWRLQSDSVLQEMLQKSAQDNISKQYTKVQAGERIIDEGQIATTRNIAMLIAMKKQMRSEYNPWKMPIFLGSALLSSLMVFVWALYLRHLHPDVYYSLKKLWLLASIVIITLVFYKTVEFFLLRNTSNLLENVRYPIVLPFTAVLLCSLLNARIAIFSCVSMAVILSLGSAMDRNGFYIANVLPAIACVMGMRGMYKRKQIVGVVFKAFVVALIVVMGLECFKNILDPKIYIIDASVTLIFMLLVAVLVIGLMPLFEAVFNVMTDVTLMEYMDPSHELLKRLMVEAPGTYQHSIVVGNLSEAAAVAIGANGLFCRVATQYHDIGKLVAPQYFTENQQAGVSMHQLLTPLESAQVIISHVNEGVTMARKARLPESFISIIKEHHGSSLVYYFYHKQIELMGGDGSLVDDRDFRYLGPKPRSKESAVIMIADSLEAASRSLDEFSEETVSNLVERLVAEKAEDGQFDECQLTFEELQTVKKALIKTICAYGHSRVKYPTKKLRQALHV